MELNLPAHASTCFVSGEPFADGERVVSLLVRHRDNGEVMRYDLKESAEPQFEAPGRVACRWIHTYKVRAATENPERELKLTAENLFLTLADPATELSPENARMVQFLALMLERKRVIKPKGQNADRTRNVFEHVRSKQRYEVPAGDLDPAFFVSVQEQLSVLVGEPKAKTANPEAPAGSHPAAS